MAEWSAPQTLPTAVFALEEWVPPAILPHYRSRVHLRPRALSCSIPRSGQAKLRRSLEAFFEPDETAEDPIFVGGDIDSDAVLCPRVLEAV